MAGISDYLDFKTDFHSNDFVLFYDELPLWSSMFGLLLLKYVPLRPSMNVLDIGFGTGFPLLELAQRFGATSRIVGIDPWQVAIYRAKRKADYYGLKNADVIQGDASRIPFPDRHFDLIVSNLGINNFDHRDEAFMECNRVLSASGKIVITTNLEGHMAEFYEIYAETLLEFRAEKSLEALSAHIKKRVNLEGLKGLFEKNGFRVSRLYTESANMRFLDGSSLLRHNFIKNGFLDAWKSVIETEQQGEIFQRLEANLNKYAVEHGELDLTIPMAYIEGERMQV